MSDDRDKHDTDLLDSAAREGGHQGTPEPGTLRARSDARKQAEMEFHNALWNALGSPKRRARSLFGIRGLAEVVADAARATGPRRRDSAPTD